MPAIYRAPPSARACDKSTSMHVWLCDNTGPVWQAPCIIALGRVLHNNVGLGNACGLGPSAVSGPIKVLLCSFPMCLQPVRTHTNTHTHKLWEIDGTPHFSYVNKSWGLSLLNWMVKFHTEVFLFSDWWEAVMADRPNNSVFCETNCHA